MTRPLPPTSSTQPPAFACTSPEQCRAWLDSTPLSDPAQAQASLLSQVNVLNCYSLPPTDRLAILELLELPVAFVQAESQRKFAGRPLPLAAAEQAVFDACQALWLGLITGYRHCWEATLADCTALRPKAGLIALRILKHLADAQADAYRGGHPPHAESWALANETYAAAAELGFAEQPVAGETGNATPQAVHGEMMLLHAASPYELNLRQLTWVQRWSQRWAGKLKVSATPPAAIDRAVPLCVDLASDRPASYHPGAGAGVRWLDTGDLRRSVSARLALLEKGESPVKLQLGQDCVQPACGQLLMQVYRRWCKGGIPRRHERRAADGPCSFVGGFEAIHYYISGRKPFRPPGHADMDQLRREREEIATFGRVSTRRDEDFSKQQGFQVEEWEVRADWDAVDESATGLHVARPAKHANGRIGAGQLVAVQPAGARALMLGNVRWSMVDNEDRIHAGIMIFPGLPEAVAVRSTGLAAVNEKYRQAFLLPAMAALNEPATAIIPSSLFKRDRILEVFTDKPWQIRLTEIVDRGIDFDRVAYVR
jgi:cyclic-di-GMP-binding protein